MAVSGTLGALLQGVSQQPAAIRNDGQVTEQINMVSDVVTGLTSRPSTDLVAYNTGATAGLTFRNVTIDGNRYQIGINTGVLEIIDDTGASRNVTLDAGVSAYIAEAMEVYVYDGKVHLLNRDKVVAMDSDTSAAEALVTIGEGYVSCTGGEFSHTYTVNLEYSDGTIAVGTYTAPDGTTTGDAAKTASDYIIEQLRLSLVAHGNFKVATTAAASGSVMRISGSSDIKLTVTDGSGGTLLRAQAETAKNIEDLAVLAAHGALVRIVGSDGSEDDFWMRFEVADETVVGNSFGSEGLWRESYDPTEVTEFDLTTMPHVITLAAGDFTVSQGTWLGRRVGDVTTNAEPSFVGKSIRDINGFQSRIAVIAGSSIIMSRTDTDNDFWKQSATVEVDDDPIDIKSTAETEFSLEWLVPFDRDLIIFADASQFIIKGSAALTAANASLVQTTNFEMGDAARPASTGRTLLFPFSNGGFAGVKEFFSSAATDASDAASITQVQDEYMLGKITKLTASTNFSFVVVQTDDATESKTLFVHQYYYEGSEKKQASWSRWDMPYDVANVFFYGSQLFILMYDSVLGYVQTTLDLDIPANAETGYPIALDVLDSYTAGLVVGDYVLSDYVDTDYAEAGVTDTEHSYIDLPWESVRIVQGASCAVPGQPIAATVSEIVANTTWRHTVASASAPVGSTLWAGLPYTVSVSPTMPFIRDGSGAAIKNAKLVVGEFIVYFEDSGYIVATMASKYRSADIVHSNEQVVLAGDPDDPEGRGIRSGMFSFRWGERSDWSELTLSSDDVRPMTISEVEWVGQVLSRGRRL